MLEITSPGSGDKAILRYWVARGYPSNVALDGKIPFESGVVLDCEEGSIKFANGDSYKGSVNCDLEFGEYPIVKPDGYGVLTRADEVLQLKAISNLDFSVPNLLQDKLPIVVKEIVVMEIKFVMLLILIVFIISIVLIVVV